MPLKRCQLYTCKCHFYKYNVTPDLFVHLFNTNDTWPLLSLNVGVFIIGYLCDITVLLCKFIFIYFLFFCEMVKAYYYYLYFFKCKMAESPWISAEVHVNPSSQTSTLKDSIKFKQIRQQSSFVKLSTINTNMTNV